MPQSNKIVRKQYYCSNLTSSNLKIQVGLNKNCMIHNLLDMIQVGNAQDYSTVSNPLSLRVFGNDETPDSVSVHEASC